MKIIQKSIDGMIIGEPSISSIEKKLKKHDNVIYVLRYYNFACTYIKKDGKVREMTQAEIDKENNK